MFRVGNNVDPNQVAGDLDLQCFQNRINPSLAGQGLRIICNIVSGKCDLKIFEYIFHCTGILPFTLGNGILADRIRISDILSWFRNSLS